MFMFYIYMEIYGIHPFFLVAQVTHSVDRASYARRRRLVAALYIYIYVYIHIYSIYIFTYIHNIHCDI